MLLAHDFPSNKLSGLTGHADDGDGGGKNLDSLIIGSVSCVGRSVRGVCVGADDTDGAGVSGQGSIANDSHCHVGLVLITPL